MMNKETLRLEADRLSKDPVLVLAIDNIRRQAMEALTKVDASDAIQITALQQRVRVCDEFATQLKTMINSAQERRPVSPV